MPEIALEVSKIFAGYVPDLPILKGVSVKVKSGSLNVVIGPNGAGKSTLIKAIVGLVPVSKGRILLGGKEIGGIKPHSIAEHRISYVPQIDNIFRTLTVRQNLELALRSSDINTNERLTELLIQFPILSEKMKEKAGALSGGQRQFLAVAMALANYPDIILMDEPSAGLAPKAAQEILELLRELSNSGVAILLIEQNVNQALRLADHCYILAEGRNQVDGEAYKLLNDPIVGEIYLGGKRLRAGG